MMAGDNRPTGKASRLEAENDADLWQRAMRGTERLSPGRRHSRSAEEPVADRDQSASEAPQGRARPADASSRGSRPKEPAVPGKLDKHVIRRIKRRVQGVEARLDLHGMTQKEAHVALRRFIRDTAVRGCRCVLVITGKGGRSDTESEFRSSALGVLRRSVPYWLKAPDLSRYVAGFEPALPKHGGAGALYVQLRRGQPDGRG